MTAHDPRLNAIRGDLADARLKGQVEAERHVEGRPARVVAAVADCLRSPDADAPLDTQFLAGDEVVVFETRDNWCWVQARRDGYVGYVAESALGAKGPAATHIVAVPRSFLYAGPDLRLPRRGEVSLGSQVTVTDFAETRGTRYAILASGRAMIAAHLTLLGAHAPDYVAIAETLLFTPYLWGGASAFGIDCSGLVQLSIRMAGRDILRDSDMQAAGLGMVIDPGQEYSSLRRGDLVFWKGHVAIMTDAADMVHASGYAMMVCREPLVAAVARIRHLYGEPTIFRRP